MANQQHWHTERPKQKREKTQHADSYIKKGIQGSFLHNVYVVGWVDLLGYGAMLRECSFDITSKNAKDAVRRIALFQSVLQEKADKYMPILQLNDGAILWRRLSFRTTSITFDFIKRAIDLFVTINEIDMENGFYGARMVIAAGLYTSINNARRRDVRIWRADNLLQQIKNEEKTIEEAIHEACFHQGYINEIQELQANFAFTKAYAAESSGKEGGFEGNHLFIDCNLLDLQNLNWMKYGKEISWVYPGLSGNFIEYMSMDSQIANARNGAGIQTTEGIAMTLLGNVPNKQELLARLKGV